MNYKRGGTTEGSELANEVGPDMARCLPINVSFSKPNAYKHDNNKFEFLLDHNYHTDPQRDSPLITLEIGA